MPAVTLFTLGAAGIAGAAAYKYSKRRDPNQTSETMSPLAMGRRPSGGLQNDLYDAGNQAEKFWRRDYGVNFSHNADRSFPVDARKMTE